MATDLSYPSIAGMASSPTSAAGAPYISELSDTANIQNTIKYFYYGLSQTPTTDSGIYGMLTQLQNQINAAVAGVNVHENAKYASIAAYTVTVTNGSADASGGVGIGYKLTNAGAQAAFSIDGYTALAGDVNNLRVLIKDQADATQNGIYLLTTLGSGSTNWVLTRAEDSNNSIAGECGEGDFVFITDGTNGNKAYVLTSPSATGTGPAGSIKIGTNSINFTQYFGVGTYYVGTTTVQATSFAQILTGVSLSDSTSYIVDVSDNTKKIQFDITGTTGITGVLQTAFTTAKTITFPDIAGQLSINPTTTIGDIIYASATGTPGTLARLAGNTASGTYVLISSPAGTAVAPTWSSAATGTGSPVFSASPAITGTLTASTITAAGASTLTISSAATNALSTSSQAVTLSSGNASGTTSNSGNVSIDVGTATATKGTLNIGNTNAATINIGTSLGTAIAVGASTGTLTIGNATITGTNATSLNLNGSTTITIAGSTATTGNILNTTQTILNIGGAATTLSLGNVATAAQTVNMFTASTGASTYNFATGATASTTIKTVALGGGGVSGSITNVTLGSTVSGAIVRTITPNILHTASTTNTGTTHTITAAMLLTRNIIQTTATTAVAYTLDTGTNMDGTTTTGFNTPAIGTTIEWNIFNDASGTATITISSAASGHTYSAGSTTTIPIGGIAKFLTRKTAAATYVTTRIF